MKLHNFQKDFFQKNKINIESLQILSEEETKLFRKKFVETYIDVEKCKNDDVPLHRCEFCMTGDDKSHSFNWHAFSYEGTPCKKVEIDFFKNNEIEENSILFLWEECGFPAVEISADHLKNIDFSVEYFDIYVFPRSLDWVFISTHENGWIGPFYSNKGMLKNKNT